MRWGRRDVSPELLSLSANSSASSSRSPATTEVPVPSSAQTAFEICRVFTEHACKIAPSTYYAAGKRLARPSARQLRRRAQGADQRCPSGQLSCLRDEKVWRELHRQGHTVARCTVERLMRGLGLAGAVRGKQVITTVPDASVERAPDLVDRDFATTAPTVTATADSTVRQGTSRPPNTRPATTAKPQVTVRTWSLDRTRNDSLQLADDVLLGRHVQGLRKLVEGVGEDVEQVPDLLADPDGQQQPAPRLWRQFGTVAEPVDEL